jgi:hypothetical protein
MLRSIRKYHRAIAASFVLLLLSNVFLPGISYAVTGHSSMPEYRSFEPVSTTNMVNPLTGDFTYNIPLMNVPNGYPLNLSYHSSEINTEAQASWVGLGWTLNPGSINRTKRGFPDEYDGAPVTYYNKMPDNWTLSLGAGPAVEAFGFQASLVGSLRYNNYKGFGRIVSGGIGYEGMANLGFSYERGRIKFNPSINPIVIAAKIVKASENSKKKKNDDTYDEGDQATKVKEAIIENWKSGSANYKQAHKAVSGKQQSFLARTSASLFSFDPVQAVSVSTTTPQYHGFAFDLNFELGVNGPPMPVDISGKAVGAFSIQHFEGTINRNAYGYFNLESRTKDDATDYYTEIENTFEKKDRYLGIPFASYDLFALSGEALGGSFRGYRSDYADFYKEASKSSSVQANLGADIALPSGITFPPGILDLVGTYGGTIGGGYSEINTGDWNAKFTGNASFGFKSDADFKTTTNEKVVFRFAGDQAGSFERTTNDDVVQAQLIKHPTTSVLQLTEIPQVVDKRVNRSSYISMHTDDDFNKISNQVRYDVFQKQLFVADFGTPDYAWNDYNATRTGKGLGEVVSYNEDGVRYVYGLPLRVKNEKEIRVNLKSGEYSLEQNQGLIANVTNAGLENSSDFKVGFSSPAGYASQFLLTQITSTDYLDRTMNGLTPDDFGTYTRFNYVKATTNADWYKFRSPFKGTSFSYGSLSDPKDDMGSFSAGEKELYYIQSVSSKTHVAIFILSDRTDGKGAANIDITGGGSGRSLKKLDRIELYALADCDEVTGKGVYKPKAGIKPIQTVNLSYDYRLCKGTPNSAVNTGKLTLTKVWFDYEGKIKSKIAPYTFGYNYPAPGTYPSKYTALEMGIASNAAAQNPDYNVLDSDGWGNYRDYTSFKTRLGSLAQFFPFSDQQEPTTSDPAAWCMKTIKLPSGGEIHVQYEQNDYQYIQDKRAMLMVPLLEDGYTGQAENDLKDKPYYIDLDKIGVSTTGKTDQQLMDLANDLFEPMTSHQDSDRMYFNFLYSLIGDDEPDHQKLYSDYVEGYARVSGYGVHNGKIYFYFWQKPSFSGGPYHHEVDLGRAFNKRDLPRKACEDFYRSSRQGRISEGSNSLGTNDINAGSLGSLFSKAKQVLGVTKVCFKMKPSMSYVRLQLPKDRAKKGGGIRVKRILMYDKGIDQNNDKVLYGQEYDYTVDGLSSGVTPNEPGTIRRENALVHPLDRDNQSQFDAMLYGEDIYDNEGPIGHSIYPGGSVAYSKVTISNIHKGKTSDGYQVYEYYTCKDYPIIAKHSTIERQHEAPIGGGIVSGPYQRVTPHLTQGYVFISNDMHGKLKRMAKYALGTTTPVYEELYEYNRIADPVRVMDENKKVNWQVLGKESEMYAERKEANEFSAGASFGLDVTAGAWIALLPILPLPPIFVPIPFPISYVSKISASGYVNEQILRTHVTSKVINYSVLPKKVTTRSNGIVHVSENLVFDKYTGKPVITRSMDDFDKPYINQTFMASWDYTNLRSKALNEDLIVNAMIGKNGAEVYLQFGPTNGGCDGLNKFVPGDFLALRSGGSPGTIPALYHVTELDKINLRVKLVKSSLDQGQTTLVHGATVEASILQSGRTNQLTAESGSLVAYNRPGVYNYSTPTTSTAITDFLNLLNTAHTNNNGIVQASALPANLKLIDPISGECVKGKDFQMNMEVNKVNGKTHVRVGNKNNSSQIPVTQSYVVASGSTGTITADEGGCYQLTDALHGDRYYELAPAKAAIWNQTKIDLSTCFQMKYKVNFGNRNVLGADGMTFVLHNDPRGFNAIGGSGGDLGAGGRGSTGAPVSPSLGIEFDTYFNSIDEGRPDFGDYAMYNGTYADCSNSYDFLNHCASNPANCDPLACSRPTVCSCADLDFDHISIYWHDLLGQVTGIPVAAIPDNSIYGAKNIEDGNYHDVTIDWNANTKVLNVYFDGMLRKTMSSYDMATGIFGGVNQVYFGWTAGQYLTNDQTVCPVSVYQGCGGSSTPGCVSVLNGTNGTFIYNQETGYIQYDVAGACAQNVDCLILCEASEPEVIGGVITANAQTYSDTWSYDLAKYPILSSSTLLANMNAYETGQKGKWRVNNQYAYRTSIAEGRNYASGEMLDFTVFNWKNPEVNDYNKWLLTTNIAEYTPNGNVAEDRNLLDVYSTALYGYNNTLPLAVAQNARSGKILYEGFENCYEGNGSKYYLENGYEISAASKALLSTQKAHTGKYAFKCSTNTDIGVGKVLYQGGKLITKVWVTADRNMEKLKDNLVMKIMGQTIPLKFISAAGSWMQFEAQLISGATGFDHVTIRINQPGNVDFGNIYVDDVRSQPVDAQMTCYVYDQSQRLLAVLDDQHYALIYQYNSEGILVRKLKETVKGIKTISETQYNVKGENRP